MLGKPVPDFSLPSTGGNAFQLSSRRGSKVVLYFYPRDDSLATHQRFKEKMKFPFELPADADQAVCERFGVMKLKNLYGKQVRGIERSTLVIDEKGLLAREWRGVKVPGHVQEVLNFVKSL
jgi:peroxiredoxin Q/BCP